MVAISGGGQLASRVKSTFLEPRLLSEVVKTNDFRLTGESKFVNGQGSVTLDWDRVSDTSDGYIVQRTTNSAISDDDFAWEVAPTNYGKHVKILNVYPPGGNFLKGWMNQNNGTGQPVSMNLIDVTEVSLPNFNANPDGYLKDAAGNYQYDGIYFGSADSNGGWTAGVNDLTAISQPAVAAFADTGRSLILGHDTICDISMGVHPYFNMFASKIGIELARDIESKGGRIDSYNWRGSNQVSFTTNGTLNQYPYNLDSNAVYNISSSHSLSQFFMYDGETTRWMHYSSNVWSGGSGPFTGNTNYAHDGTGKVIGDDNWYLVTKNNYAMIQTGHSNGSCTPDEAKIIANMTYYTSTLNTTTHGEDYTVKDTAVPDSPTESLNGLTGTQLSLNINSQDEGSDYYYRVKAKSDVAAKYSDVIKTTVTSGIKGYVYTVDANPTGTPPVIKNPSTGVVTNINLNPTSSSDPQAILNLSLPASYGKYVHIVAVDNANNVSEVKNINLNDFKWWDIDPTTKVLTIYPHELNGSVDTTGASVWPWHGQAADVTKVVIKPGVTARGSLHNLFTDLTNATAIEGLASLDTSNVTDMNAMFAQCQSLTSLDVSKFKTANVTDMNSMFNYCTRLTSLDVSSFVTNQVTSMRGMFQGCLGITELDLNNFNTSLVQDFSYMFNEMHGLKKLNVTSFNTSSATDMTVMFAHMSVLPSLDLSSFNTSNVTTMTSMFDGSPKLWQLTLGSTSKLATDCALKDPRVEDEIIDSLATYYVTNPNWREVGSGGTVHDPKGTAKTAAQIISDSSTATGTRIYVWDQQGRQTLTTTGSIDFGTHRGSIRAHNYTSAAQSFNITDNRNSRNGKVWRVEASLTKQFELATDTTKKISGNPLYYQSNGATTNLTSTAQTVYNGTAGSGYQDALAIPWNLSFKARASDIPAPGHYKATVTYTLVNVP
ncbi:BspA family leucine-rich repeat surface protein [Xylocopilactobacillus apicola]|uniref:Surface protein n=1 Tax=Xylocopilactobacillus apicola TaxID=2932184 RepID=A0AAU9DSW5_9LACO|nr:BspA family leucine-rich repeat surface protein [Xylocopilactobacillus apicola]BDR58403.1 hypothetical protein XA3_08440 [Xylocopilactobacillus apicola]